MSYEEFKEEILEVLRDYYRENAKIDVVGIVKNNDIKLDGLCINETNSGTDMIPIIYLQDVYKTYEAGKTMEECAEDIINFVTKNDYPDFINQAIGLLGDWGEIKDKVYPFLLSTERNKDLLQNLVSRKMMDFSVAYMIRETFEDKSNCAIKINYKMLERYGIDEDQLHMQAMENLKKDMYVFQDMFEYIKSLAQLDHDLLEMCLPETNFPRGFMYILSNGVRYYGAAGILDKELLQRVVPNRNHYVIPASIHETIFVPDDGCKGKDDIDEMIRGINETVVSREEWLQDHCYYYDAEIGEIRMCD